ncbi:TVP38/TMEM64 family protein [Paenibacillus filicis]|uniref:TVP38/TMEM64 family membrane protein n=1 Tax=Paenibacillus gyeongsangnamensis TaxID=3388067 RepID=A0ABT4QJ93_9BACL|nr:TVP38/TMEM64 family protein [Paenibacillus filicis]MCZ8516953.1 TVP38/TMEM64 family protein [Paenibacillus filicis]
MKKQSAIVKMLALFAGVGMLYWINHAYIHATPQGIRDWILSFGWIAPLLFIFLYTLRPLLLFPASVLSIAGGLAFGVWWGTVFTVIGATTGAALSFFVARFLGNNAVRKKWTGSWSRLERKLRERGFIYVLLLRLIPLFPFDLISYVAGVSKIRFRSFIYGTFIGIIPGTFAYNFLGSSFTKGSVRDILIASGVFLAALTIPILFRKRFIDSTEIK